MGQMKRKKWLLLKKKNRKVVMCSLDKKKLKLKLEKEIRNNFKSNKIFKNLNLGILELDRGNNDPMSQF